MIKIGIYSKENNKKNEINKSLKNYFNGLLVETQISYIRTKYGALNSLAVKYSEYNLIFICEENNIIYVKRNVKNHLNNFSGQTVGWSDYPLTAEKIDKILIDVDSNNCPKGIFGLNTRKTVRAISYSEIEFFQRIGSKTIIHLTNDETEETNESIKTVKEKLQEVYFIECLKGNLVNLYNIKKIDKPNKKLIMKSGHTISISKKKYTDIISLFINILFGI